MNGIKLRIERRKRNWTIEKLAKKLGVSTNLISKIEKGKSPLNNSMSLILKEKLDLDIKPKKINKSREAEILEKALNKIFKKQKIAVDEDNKMISIVLSCELGIYKTYLAYSNIKDENEVFIYNEAKAIMYELLQKMEE